MRERVSRLEKSNAERERLAQAKSAELDTQERINRQRAAIRASEPAEPTLDSNLFAKKGFLIKKTDDRYIKTEVYKKAVKDKNEPLYREMKHKQHLTAKTICLSSRNSRKPSILSK